MNALGINPFFLRIPNIGILQALPLNKSNESDAFRLT